MRPNKRAQRKTETAVAGLKDFLIAMGKNPDEVDKAFDNAPMHNDEAMLQAEGVLLHLLQPTRFVSKKCKREACGQVFGTSYRSVAYCSDNCRAKDLEAQTGIRWNPHTDRYRSLQGEKPLVIGPQAYQALLDFAHYILGENHIEVDQSLDQTDQTLPQQEEVDFEQLANQLLVVPQTSPDISPQQSNGHVPEDLIDPFGF